MIFAIGGPGGASAEDGFLYVGLGLMALGLLALWYHQECYMTYQWIKPYPHHGPVYILIQFIAPFVVVLGGIGLIAIRFSGT